MNQPQEPAQATELANKCIEMGQRARAASRQMALAVGAAKNLWLQEAAAALEAHVPDILAANARDLALAPTYGLTSAQCDRLTLTPQRIQAAAAGLRAIMALPDPVGRILDGSTRPNGLEVRKVGVPLGVLLFLYESRPNVTIDAAGLAIKSGNALILRGGKEALHSNVLLHRLLQDALERCALPRDAVQLVDSPDRALVGQLLQLNKYIDLVIPRGGESLIRRVALEATMPVLKHYKGVCHVYVDRDANLQVAEQIVVNAKCQRPGVCNAMECLLVHQEVAPSFLPQIGAALRCRGVEIRGCPETRRWLADALPATEADYDTEYLDLVLSLRVVPGLEPALDHIARHGSQHTDAIVTTNLETARQFVAQVDSAAVMVNASTRFNDGFELGLGAEIGISTDKLHARGPCGLQELTTYKYVVTGAGHIRE